MSWSDRLKRIVESGASQSIESFLDANAGMIRGVLLGYGPDSQTASDEAGLRVVFNMSTAHVPAFFAAGTCTATVRPYQNRYDRQRLGSGPPPGIGIRERIDEAVGEAASQVGPPLRPTEIYYGALELNGAGIRYFGDASLVLRRDRVASGTVVLCQNSYDLARKPVVDWLYVAGNPSETRRRAVAALVQWRGCWPDDPPLMAACKILEASPAINRRLTTAAISSGVLADEQYLEVVRRGSFGRDDLEEMRLFAADAAAEARIADRAGSGPPCSLAELLWRHRRRAAERAAAQYRVRTRVVTTLGRDRG